MKPLLLTILLFISPQVNAGKIYGALQINGEAVSTHSTVTIKCGATSYQAKVQKYGRYSINVIKEGPCTMTLTIPGQGSASASIVSYHEATRYNFMFNNNGLKRT